MNGVTPLRDAGFRLGGKAATLGRLLRAGFPVPDGVVVSLVPGGRWQRPLADAVVQLGGGTYAVRSSATGEDGRLASFAGQYRTVLDVAAEQVEEQVRYVASTDAGHSGAYAAATAQPAPAGIAVIVQRMLLPVAAGVAFTRHPVTGSPSAVVEAVAGLGEALVSGNAAPQRWQSDGGGRLTWSGPEEVLTAAQAGLIIRLASQVEDLLGEGQDIEWAITGDHTPWILQARPITAPTAGLPPVQPPARPSPGGTSVLAAGTPASPGTCRARLRIIHGIADFSLFRPGEVLVCRATSPAWMPLLAQAAAVVTATGGILSHAAIIARELRIPAVTEVAGATSLPAGALVTVDGGSGTIVREEP